MRVIVLIVNCGCWIFFDRINSGKRKGFFRFAEFRKVSLNFLLGNLNDYEDFANKNFRFLDLIKFVIQKGNIW